jgi:hypothetical protein
LNQIETKVRIRIRNFRIIEEAMQSDRHHQIHSVIQSMLIGMEQQASKQALGNRNETNRIESKSWDRDRDETVGKKN